MQGIITTEQIEEIKAAFGSEIAEKAMQYKGTFLNFLVENGNMSYKQTKSMQ